jgi:ElaB/YqjD/DUF883 family membrane-anchored ribosome-binding protein
MKQNRKAKREADAAKAAAAQAAQNATEALAGQAGNLADTAKRAEHDVEEYIAAHGKPLRTAAMSAFALVGVAALVIAILRARS